MGAGSGRGVAEEWSVWHTFSTETEGTPARRDRQKLCPGAASAAAPVAETAVCGPPRTVVLLCGRMSVAAGAGLLGQSAASRFGGDLFLFHSGPHVLPLLAASAHSARAW